jgi:hypothetical protein
MDVEPPAISTFAASGHEFVKRFAWPTPIHDTLFGYSWITANLAPEKFGRRNIYVYGSYLGASLAASLALTESHSHQRMAVRGLVAHNGIYNWTAFLPDSTIHKIQGANPCDLTPSEPEGSAFHYLKQQTPTLFRRPSDLFDPFASACLFFHSAGMLVPPGFGPSALPPSLLRAIDELSAGRLGSDKPSAPPRTKVPRRGYFAFPPRRSTLKIPETLLLHETPQPSPLIAGRRGRRPSAERARSGENSFGTQATALASVMRRSIDKLELKERRKWDDEFQDWDGEAERRIQVVDVGPSRGEAELEGQGGEVVRLWIGEKMKGHC